MIQTIETLVNNFACGKLSRRQLVLSLATMVASAQPGSKEKSFRAVSINHVTVKVPDLHRTSHFYQQFFGMPLKQQSANTHILGVGESFFGIEQGNGQSATVDHYDFGITAFNADEIRMELKRRDLKTDGSASKESFKFHDPDGFQVQVNAPDYVGHVS
jgi:catechol 2,3-dioxygenase-like lactoylglutathione lyase family enzyme